MSTKRRDVVSASEIAAYAFCPEAWRLGATGEEPGNKAELACGKAFHERTARVEVWSRRLVAASLWLLVLAIVVAALGYVVFGGAV